jgi:hypothetical protein
VTVVDLESGETQAMDVAEGDYMLIPFAPCYLHHTQRHLTGTVQITLRDHRPAGPPLMAGDAAPKPYGPNNPQCSAEDSAGRDCAGPEGHLDGSDHSNVNGTWTTGGES